jgi:hypothetical protein
LAKRVCTEIQQALEKVRNKFCQVNIAKYGKHFANGLWSYLGDTLQPYVLKRVQKYYRHNVFTPFNVLRGMDLDSALSYKGVEVLRRVESGGKKYFRGLLPSSAELKRWAAKIEWFARGHFPYQLRSMSDGEAVRFDYAKTTKTVMKAFYLTEVAALRPVSVGFSIDGMSLSKNVDATISGIRVNDRSAQDPLTGQLILSDPSTMIAQSCTLCQPLKLGIGRESAKFDEMSTVFEFMNKISKDETLPEELADFKAFATCVCCNMSAGWKGADKGGGAKQYEEPCHCCNLKSDHLAKPNEAHCTRWCHQHAADDPNWKCYHKDVATPERVAAMESDVEELKQSLNAELEEIQKDSKIVRTDVEAHPPPQNSMNNPLSIHFQPEDGKK